MKGIVFTSLSDMVCKKFGMDTWDEVLEHSQVESKGAYTSVGNYPVDELHQLVKSMSELLNVEGIHLYSEFGVYLSNVFITKFPEFFIDVSNTFDLLMNVDNYIHEEVRKLYPDASLPKLEGSLDDPNNMTLEYKSPNCLSYFAEGLILGVGAYFQESIVIQREPLKVESGQHVIFHLTKTRK